MPVCVIGLNNLLLPDVNMQASIGTYELPLILILSVRFIFVCTGEETFARGQVLFDECGGVCS